MNFKRTGSIVAIAAGTVGGHRLDLRRASSLSPGEYTVLHVSCSDAALVAVETHGPVL